MDMNSRKDRYDYFIDGPNGPEPIGSHAICTICLGVKEMDEKHNIFCPECDRVAQSDTATSTNPVD